MDRDFNYRGREREPLRRQYAVPNMSRPTHSDIEANQQKLMQSMQKYHVREVERLQKENDENRAPPNQAEELASLQKSAEAKNVEFLKLEAQSTQHAKQIRALRDEKENFDVERSEFESEIQQLKFSRDALSQELQTGSSKNAELDISLSTVQAQLKEVTEESETKVSSLEGDLKTTKDKLKLVEEQLHASQTDGSGSAAKCVELQQKLAGANEKVVLLDEKEKKLEELQEQYDILKQFEKDDKQELAEMRDKFAKSEENLARVQETCAKAEEKCTKAEEELGEKATELLERETTIAQLEESANSGEGNLTELETRIADLVKEKAELVSSAESVQKTIEEAQVEVKNLVEDHNAADREKTAQLTALQTKNAELESSITDVQNQLEGAKIAAGEAEARMQAQTAEFAQKLLDSETSGGSQLEEAKKQLADMEKKYKQQLEEGSAAKDAATEAADREIVELKAALSASNVAHTDKETSTQEKMDSYEETAAKLTKELQEAKLFEVDMEEMRDRYLNSQKEVAEGQDALEKALLALRSHRDQDAEERMQEISEFNTKYDAAINKHETEVGELRSKITASEKELNATKQQAEESLATVKEEISEKDKKIEEINGIKADLEKSIASLRGELDSTRTELNDKLQNESEKVTKLEARRKSLQGSLETFQTTGQDADVARKAMAERILEIETEANEANKSLQAAQDKISAMTTEHKKELDTLRASLTSENRAKMVASEAVLGQTKLTLQSELDKTKRQLALVEKEKHSAAEELANTFSEMESLKTRLSEKDVLLGSLRSEMTKLTSLRDDDATNLKTITERAQKAESEWKTSETAKVEALEKLACLQSELTTLSASFEATKTDIAALTKERDALSTDLASAREAACGAEVAAMHEKRCEEKQEEILRLKQDIVDIEKRIDEVKADHVHQLEIGDQKSTEMVAELSRQHEEKLAEERANHQRTRGVLICEQEKVRLLQERCSQMEPSDDVGLSSNEELDMLKEQIKSMDKERRTALEQAQELDKTLNARVFQLQDDSEELMETLRRCKIERHRMQAENKTVNAKMHALQPMVKLLERHSIDLPEWEELAKWVKQMKEDTTSWMAVGDRLAGFNDVNLKEPGMKVMHGELCADYNAAQEKFDNHIEAYHKAAKTLLNTLNDRFNRKTSAGLLGPDHALPVAHVQRPARASVQDRAVHDALMSSDSELPTPDVSPSRDRRTSDAPLRESSPSAGPSHSNESSPVTIDESRSSIDGQLKKTRTPMASRTRAGRRALEETEQARAKKQKLSETNDASSDEDSDHPAEQMPEPKKGKAKPKARGRPKAKAKGKSKSKSKKRKNEDRSQHKSKKRR